MCITLTHFGSRKKEKKRGSLWHALLEVSPGGVHETHEPQKKRLTHTDSRFDDAGEASQHGGTAIRSQG